MKQNWIRYLNTGLASLLVTLGFWILWGDLPLIVTVGVALIVVVLLLWQGTTIGEVWAWATLLLGLESLAWPIVTMIQVRLSTPQPTEEQTGRILIAVLFGFFSSIFWLTFAYGIFKWVRRSTEDSRGRTDSLQR
jgi:hypothetical protein